MKNKLLLSLASTVCALSLCTSTLATTAKTEKEPTHYSFVIKSPQSKLLHVKGKTYQLVVPMSDVKSVLAFSDRPARIVKKLSVKEYVTMVNSGSDSFKKDNPNVALTVSSYPTEVFVLTGVVKSKSKNEVAYQLTLLDNQKNPSKQAGQMVMFVDFIISGGGTFPI